MSRSTLSIDEEADRNVSERLGAVVRIMMGTNRRVFNVDELRRFVFPAVVLGQLKIHYSLRNEPVGYATWAYLSPRAASRIRTEGDPELHFSEWNEGLELWIMDFCSLKGYASAFAKELRETVFPERKDAFAYIPSGRANAGKVLKFTHRDRS